MNSEEAQAWVGAAALVVTGLGLLRETRSRNRDRRDADAGPARTVVTEVEVASFTELQEDPAAYAVNAVRVHVTNHGTTPILNLAVSVWPEGGDEIPGEWFSVVAPGGTATATVDVAPAVPFPDGAHPEHLTAASINFTDAAGLQWKRTNNDGPHRWIDPTRPIWWLRARYRWGDRIDKIRRKRL